MKKSMKKLSALIFLIGVCISFNANAWFFFFIPGSVISAVSDAITGNEGDNCVGQQVAVGGIVKLSNGGSARVKSLSGVSSRCPDSNMPVRAMLEPIQINTPITPNTVITSSAPLATQARLDLPDSWEQKPLSDGMKAGRNVLYTVNRTTDSGLLLATVSRRGIADLGTYALTRSATAASRLDNPTQSGVTKVSINGTPAWQFVITGTTKVSPLFPSAASGMPMTVLQTIYEGKDEIIVLNSWTTTANYQNQEAELQRIAHSMTGITLSSNSNMTNH